MVGSALRLGPVGAARFLPVLNQEFPELAERYREHYARSEGASPAYQRALTRRLQELQREHGFPVLEGMRHREQVEGRPLRRDAVRLQASLL